MKIPIPKSLFRRLAWIVVLLTAAAFLALALRPEPVEVDVATAVRAVFFSVLSAEKQAQALRSAVESSQSALDANKLGYQVGVRINIDVLNAQR